MNKYYYTILLLLIVSCNIDKKGLPITEKVEIASNKILEDLNLKGSTNVYGENDTLFIQFKDSGIPLILNEFEQLKSEYFIYQLDTFELFDEFSFVKMNNVIYVKTENDTANFSVTYDANDYKEINKVFNTNKIYLDFTYNLIANLNYDNYIMFDAVLNDLNNHNEQFNYDGSFFTLIHLFSVECGGHNPKSEELIRIMKDYCEKEPNLFYPEIQALSYFLQVCR